MVFSELALFFLLVFLAASFLIFLIYVFPLFFGAPYVTTSKKKIEIMLELAELKSKDVLYDLGSGDGRIVIEAAKKYDVSAIGIELNPILVFLSRRRIKKLGLENKVKIYQGNFFRKDFSDANVIIIYLFQLTNRKLEKKFLGELKPGTKIVSESFTFKNIPFIKSYSEFSYIRLYKIPE